MCQSDLSQGDALAWHNLAPISYNKGSMFLLFKKIAAFCLVFTCRISLLFSHQCFSHSVNVKIVNLVHKNCSNYKQHHRSAGSHRLTPHIRQQVTLSLFPSSMQPYTAKALRGAQRFLPSFHFIISSPFIPPSSHQGHSSSPLLLLLLLYLIL